MSPRARLRMGFCFCFFVFCRSSWLNFCSFSSVLEPLVWLDLSEKLCVAENSNVTQHIQNTQEIKRTLFNWTKRAKFRGSPLFQATHNIKTEKQTIQLIVCQFDVGGWRKENGMRLTKYKIFFLPFWKQPRLSRYLKSKIPLTLIISGQYLSSLFWQNFLKDIFISI